MATDLISRIIGPCKKSPQSRQSSQDLSNQEVLAEFLRRGRDEFLGQEDGTSSYSKYKDWPMLFGDPKMYSAPLRYLEEAKLRVPEEIAQVKKLLKGSKLEETGVSPEIIRALRIYSATAYTMLDRESALYELIVKYAGEIGTEHGAAPVDVVKSQEYRNEIYRRMLPTREDFQLHNTATVAMYTVYSSIRINSIKLYESVIGQLEEIPFIGHLLAQFERRQTGKAKQQLPPLDLFRSFLEDVIAYNANQADRIYGSNSGNAQGSRQLG